MVRAEGRRLYSEMHRLSYANREKTELPRQWKEIVNVPVYGNNVNTLYSN